MRPAVYGVWYGDKAKGATRGELVGDSHSRSRVARPQCFARRIVLCESMLDASHRLIHIIFFDQLAILPFSFSLVPPSPRPFPASRMPSMHSIPSRLAVLSMVASISLPSHPPSHRTVCVTLHEPVDDQQEGETGEEDFPKPVARLPLARSDGPESTYHQVLARGGPHLEAQLCTRFFQDPMQISSVEP